MRTTLHNARRHKRGGHVFSSRHNDRNFDVANAEHIDAAKSADNVYWFCDVADIPERPKPTGNDKADKAALEAWQEWQTFDAAEERFYQSRYGKQLADTNAVYIKTRQRKRVKKMSEWRQDPLHCPQEQVLYIGKTGDTVDPQLLQSCLDEWLGKMNQWNEEHGNHVHYLNWAMHVDEQGAPHVHVRRVFDYTDDKGIVKVGQDKALKAAGVEIYDTEKPQGRYNSRIRRFTEMETKLWQNIAIARGLDIETKPLPRRNVGKPLAQYIAQQEQERVDKSAELDSREVAVKGREDKAKVKERENKDMEQVNKLRTDLLNDRAIHLGLREDTLNKALKVGRGLRDRVAGMTRKQRLAVIDKLATDTDLAEMTEYIGTTHNLQQQRQTSQRRASTPQLPER